MRPRSSLDRSSMGRFYGTYRHVSLPRLRPLDQTTDCDCERWQDLYCGDVMISIAEFREFVAKCHFPQKYNSSPYIWHCDYVRDLGVLYSDCYPDFRTKEFEFACLGHDLLEDTGCKEEHLIEIGLPRPSIELIKLVTDEPGRNRKEKKEKTYPKIRSDVLAVGLKLCDRLANLSNCRQMERHDLMGMYRAEHTEFVAKLHRPGEYDRLWAAVNGCFEYGLGE